MTGLRASAPIRVLVIDDTRTIRAMIRSVLDSDPRFEVVGEAGDPYAARDLIKTLAPDVLTLDVEMPRMNGLVFLRNLMRLRPMPVVMVSTRTSERSEEAVTALSLGAVDCIDLTQVHGAPDMRSKLTETLLAAAGASVQRPASGVAGNARTGPSEAYRWEGKYLLIGSSTGGVDALERLFSCFPTACPPTLVAQHMPESFLASFARRLDGAVRPKVRLARSGLRAEPGCIYLAPGGRHHLALGGGKAPELRLVEDTGGELYIPSVDVLFRSALDKAEACVAAVLTGMGRDGADALLSLRRAGARTVAQDAATSVIDGMPGAAREIGAVEHCLPIDRIGAKLLGLAGRFDGVEP